VVVREGRPLPGLSRRAKVTIAVAVGVIVLFMLLGQVVNVWTEVLWFQEVGYTRVYTGVLWTRIGLFLAIGLGMALIIAFNLWLAYRMRPLLRPHSPEQATLERYRMVLTPRIGLWIGLLAAVVGLFAGLTAQGRWQDWLLFRNGGEFGYEDPILGVDAGFYVFQYPFYRFLLGVGFAAVVLSIVGVLGMYYLYGAVRLQGFGDRVTTAARAHLSALVALFVALKAVAYWLDRRGLMLESFDLTEGQTLTGAGNASVNALLPAKEMLMWIAVIVALAVVVFANAVFRNLAYPGVALGLLAVSAIAIGVIWPWGVQTVSVNPTRGDKEAEYIAHSIAATRYAFDLEETQIQAYPGNNDTPPPQMTEDETLSQSLRLLDPDVLPQTYTQLQQVRGFYNFGDKLDVVRFPEADGDLVDYVVGVRQIDYENGLTDRQQQWQNRHSYYSHGYGIVGAPADEVVCNGQPFFASGFLGTGADGESPDVVGGERCEAPVGVPELTPEQPRVYYGDQMIDYTVVGGRDEFDRPLEEGDDTYRYDGEGGVEVGSFGRQALYAIHLREFNFLLSDVVNAESRVLYNRVPRDRVEKVAPFLTVDGDPYPVVADVPGKGSRILWVVDGYTTADTFPYSQRIDLRQETADAQVGEGVVPLATDEVNYMRNAVKATVDAYDGTVTLYAYDPEDPVLRAWDQAFGGDLVEEEIPENLRELFRYPVDMFKVQRNLLTQFWVEDPGEFFAGTDFWQVPRTHDNPDSNLFQPPYYLLTELPGQEGPTFQLTSAVSPVNRANLAAVISGAYVDGEQQLQVWTLPSSTRIAGPEQAHQRMVNSSATTQAAERGIRQELTLLEEGSGRVIYGNLLSLPYQDGMLYIEPVYVQTQAAEAFPLMQKVLMTYGQYVTLADTVEQGLSDLVEQGEAGVPTIGEEGQPPPDGSSPSPSATAEPTESPPASPTPPASPEPPPDLAEAEARMEEAEEELLAAYDSGDLQRLADALEEWANAKRALDQAQAGG
jgi:uncharacterized membrane protein (UPF0182 family)